MSDIVTGTVTGQVDLSQILRGQADIRRELGSDTADIRREVASDTSDVRREQAKEASDTRTEVVGSADRNITQGTAYFIAGQSQNFSNATALAALTATTNSNFNQTLAAIQLSAAQSQAANQLAQALLGQQLVADGAQTRALINEQKIDDLRFRNLERDRQCCDHGNHHHRPEGVLNYGPPLTASYPTAI
jgi:hypothetical protein